MVHIPFAAAYSRPTCGGITRPLRHTRLLTILRKVPNRFGRVTAILLTASVIGNCGELTGGRGGVARSLNLNDHIQRQSRLVDVQASGRKAIPSPMRSSPGGTFSDAGRSVNLVFNVPEAVQGRRAAPRRR